MTSINRSLPALVLERSPLVYFLAQVRFSPILSMVEHVATIQDRLRTIGYPVFAQQELQTVTIGPSTPAIDKVTLWHFKNVAGTSSVVLAQNYISFQTLKYSRYEEELPRILDVIAAIHAIVKIDVFERCGLRYLDVIYPDADQGQSYSTFLRPEIVGLTGEAIGVKPMMNNSVFVGATEIGTLVVKFSTSRAPALLPPELMGATLTLETSIPLGAAVGILDFDHFIDKREPFDIALTGEHLANLHDAIARAFDKCTTEEALKLWGKREIE